MSPHIERHEFRLIPLIPVQSLKTHSSVFPLHIHNSIHCLHFYFLFYFFPNLVGPQPLVSTPYHVWARDTFHALPPRTGHGPPHLLQLGHLLRLGTHPPHPFRL